MCKPPFHLHPQNSLHSWPGQLLPTRPLPFESSFSLEAFPRNQRWDSTPLCFKSEGVEPLWFMSPLLVLSTSSTTALATLTLSVRLIVWLFQQTFLQKYWETQWPKEVWGQFKETSQFTEHRIPQQTPAGCPRPMQGLPYFSRSPSRDRVTRKERHLSSKRIHELLLHPDATLRRVSGKRERPW